LVVYDRGAVSPYTTTDGHELMPTIDVTSGLVCEVGGYVVKATRSAVWDTVVELLLYLDSDDPEFLGRLMHGCRRLSDSGFEIDGMHDLLGEREQEIFDLASEREQRREQRGYVQPAQARAFLHTARRLRLSDDAPPAPSPIARAYFRGVEWAPEVQERTQPESVLTDDAETAAVLDVLRDAGVLAPQPRALLEAPAGHASPLALIQRHLRVLSEIDAAASGRRHDELSYLANLLLAGCPLQARP